MLIAYVLVTRPDVERFLTVSISLLVFDCCTQIPVEDDCCSVFV